jgi:hypothetical protein
VSRLVVTSDHSMNSIGYMPIAASALSLAVTTTRAGVSLPRGRAIDMLLTKRRAVDFCRVATAMCRRPASPGA